MAGLLAGKYYRFTRGRGSASMAPHTMTNTYPTPARRRLITLFVMVGAVMNQIDITIANVALPHMQGTTSASREEITWVLTSYIVASAVGLPLSGWLAERYGRKRLLLGSIIGFTCVSGMCGMSSTLGALIGFRLLQGVFGAALVPMAQSTLLDINPPEKHGSAMATFGLAAIAGPLLGPLAGGWLTDNLSWRWVFFINLPVGIISFLGLSAFMDETRKTAGRRLDFFGFAALAVALCGLQLFLDRGQSQDWFDSREIQIEAALAVVGFYVFIVNGFTARAPFISPAIFRDRNFVMTSLIGFALGVMIFSAMALIPPMLAQLMNYPIMSIGIIMAPRGLGTLVAMLLIGRVVNRVDPRLMMSVGLVVSALSMALLSDMSLAADGWLVVMAGVLNGFSSSAIFVALSAMAFVTLPARLRNEGAAMGTLARNMGGSVGIAVTQFMTSRNAATVQSRLAEGVRPGNPVMALAHPGFDWASPLAAGRMEGEMLRQALMVAYVDTFWALCIVGLIAAPCVWVLRPPKRG